MTVPLRMAYVRHMRTTNWSVTEAKWKTCVCGKVCKGRAAFANHARKCEQEQARSDAFVSATMSGDWTAYVATYHWAPRNWVVR